MRSGILIASVFVSLTIIQSDFVRVQALISPGPATPRETNAPCKLSHPMISSVRQAYDQHLNMVLGDVEETVTVVEVDEETYEEMTRVSSNNFLAA